MRRELMAITTVALATLSAAAARADPILYTVEFTAGSFELGDPLGLTGARFVIEYKWDAATRPQTPEYQETH